MKALNRKIAVLALASVIAVPFAAHAQTKEQAAPTARERLAYCTRFDNGNAYRYNSRYFDCVDSLMTGHAQKPAKEKRFTDQYLFRGTE